MPGKNENLKKTDRFLDGELKNWEINISFIMQNPNVQRDLKLQLMVEIQLNDKRTIYVL